MKSFIRIQYGPDADANAGGMQTTSADSGAGNSGIWDSLFGNLGGILNGAANVVAASNGNGMYMPGTQVPVIYQQPQRDNTIWIVVAALAGIAVLFFALKK